MKFFVAFAALATAATSNALDDTWPSCATTIVCNYLPTECKPKFLLVDVPDKLQPCNVCPTRSCVWWENLEQKIWEESAIVVNKPPTCEPTITCDFLPTKCIEGSMLVEIPHPEDPCNVCPTQACVPVMDLDTFVEGAAVINRPPQCRPTIACDFSPLECNEGERPIEIPAKDCNACPARRCIEEKDVAGKISSEDASVIDRPVCTSPITVCDVRRCMRGEQLVEFPNDQDTCNECPAQKCVPTTELTREISEGAVAVTVVEDNVVDSGASTTGLARTISVIAFVSCFSLA